MQLPNFSLFSGSASSELAHAVALRLNYETSPCAFERFPDGELSVRLDEPVRGRPVFIIQSMSPPVTEHLFQLLLFVDACRRAAAGRITAIVPYLGYARADQRHGRREAIAASMVATLLQAVGLDHLVTLDLHSAQIEGFYHLPVDNLTAVPAFCEELKRRLSPGTVVVSPDEGRVKMAGEYARRLGTPVAILHKHRESSSETKVTHVAGDVRGRPCLIIDDMIGTGGTVTSAIAALLQNGAAPEIIVTATHGLFVDGSCAQLHHPAVREIIVTDSITPNFTNFPNLTVVSIAPLLAAAIKRLAARESISDLLH